MIRLVKKSDYHMSQWSGGKTYQICLFPEHGQYQVGQFDYRVSTASVELPETIFTSLPGYDRIIMSIDAPICLYHEEEKIDLNPLIPYHFSGDRKTRSIGKCQDFNLIVKRGLFAKMETVNHQQEIQLKEDHVYIFYALTDVLFESTLFSGTLCMSKGDSIFLTDHLKDGKGTFRHVHSNDMPVVIAAEVYQDE